MTLIHFKNSLIQSKTIYYVLPALLQVLKTSFFLKKRVIIYCETYILLLVKGIKKSITK